MDLVCHTAVCMKGRRTIRWKIQIHTIPRCCTLHRPRRTLRSPMLQGPRRISLNTLPSIKQPTTRTSRTGINLRMPIPRRPHQRLKPQRNWGRSGPAREFEVPRMPRPLPLARIRSPLSPTARRTTANFSSVLHRELNSVKRSTTKDRPQEA